MPSSLIASLDGAIAASGRAEWVKLIRFVGAAPNQAEIPVDCLVIVNALTDQQVASGITSTDQNIIMSPTQINNAQWPGGTIPVPPPFNVDPRVPRRIIDKVVVQGTMRSIEHVDPLFGGEGGKEIVRINLRVTG